MSSGEFCYGARVGRTSMQIILNITTPHMPITTDGKAPDLERFRTPILNTIEASARRAKRLMPKVEGKTDSRKACVLRHLPAAVAQASGDGVHRFNQRQLYYKVRPLVMAELGIGDLDWGYFCAIVTDYEVDQGDIKGMTRDPRGILYHPHTGEEIPLGTEAVENYQRPFWTFNKILYSEKEGLLTILRSDGWPERNDCALLTSKGYASRAARDVLDLLGETGEPIEFYCIHDADAAGTMIYQSLVKGTKARARRKVKVVNLGLEPDEALRMKLEPEKFTAKGKRPVAKYVKPRWRRLATDPACRVECDEHAGVHRVA